MRENIINTVGVDSEIVVIDNSFGGYSIFSAYAEGTVIAKGDILCFVHDDVSFVTQDWGKNVLKHFKDDTVGVLGVAGTHFLPDMPSAWWEPEMCSQNIIQTRGYSGEEMRELVCEDKYRNSANELVAVDGVFMCIPKRLFNKISWDMKTYDGFHGYDIDVCLQALSVGYQVRMAWDILIEHNSYGAYDSDAFITSQKTIYEKWKKFLPVFRGVEMSDEDLQLRTRIVELKHEKRECEKRYRSSKEFKVGNALLHPCLFIKRRVK